MPKANTLEEQCLFGSIRYTKRSLFPVIEYLGKSAGSLLRCQLVPAGCPQKSKRTQRSIAEAARQCHSRRSLLGVPFVEIWLNVYADNIFLLANNEISLMNNKVTGEFLV